MKIGASSKNVNKIDNNNYYKNNNNNYTNNNNDHNNINDGPIKKYIYINDDNYF